MPQLNIIPSDTPDTAAAEVITGYSAVTQSAAILLERAKDILSKDALADETAIEARACRIMLMRIRTETVRVCKSLLRPIDLHRKAISGASAIIVDAVSQTETKLEVIESAFEQRKEEKKRQLNDERFAELSTIVTSSMLAAFGLIDLGNKSNKEYAEIVASAKAAAEAEEAKRVADELEAKRIADELEAKRIADELEAKRIADELEAKRAADKQRLADMALENARLEAESAALKAELKAAQDDRDAKLKIEAEAKAQKDAELKREADAKFAEAKAEAERLRVAALAPDIKKLTDVIDEIPMLLIPELSTTRGEQVAAAMRGVWSKTRKDLAALVASLEKPNP
jgi:hypothetical protein